MPEQNNKSLGEIHGEDYNLLEEVHNKEQQQPNSQDQDDNNGNKLNGKSEIQNQHGHSKLNKQLEPKDQLRTQLSTWRQCKFGDNH